MAQVSGIKRAKSTIPVGSQSTVKKRKVGLVSHDDEADIDESEPKRGMGRKGEERRLRIFRKKAPSSYIERLNRVKTQRMFLIDRKRSRSEDGTHEQEVFDVAGATGNIYQVMVNILKAREDLGYQLALLSTELADIFANAPQTPQSIGEASASTSTDTGGQRKPVEGDCPVCVMAFGQTDDIIWCKGACGNNVHRECFEQWAKSKPGESRCVYCRTPWKGDQDSIKRIANGAAGRFNHEGYVNVGSELGLGGQRDMSSYHPYWVARQSGQSTFGGLRATSSTPQGLPTESAWQSDV